jgi:hypothetical protein
MVLRCRPAISIAHSPALTDSINRPEHPTGSWPTCRTSGEIPQPVDNLDAVPRSIRFADLRLERGIEQAVRQGTGWTKLTHQVPECRGCRQLSQIRMAAN